MGKTILKCAWIAALALAAVQAEAGTRVVQFAGMSAVADNGTGVLPGTVNVNASAVCQISLINTGNQRQRLDSFQAVAIRNASGNFETTPVALGGVVESVYVPPGVEFNAGTGADSGSGGTACTPTRDIFPGGFCLIRYQVMNIDLSNFTGVCAGRFTVSDAPTATGPGTMVATGTILMNQEAQVLGGILSGAQYQGGTHADSTTGTGVPPAMQRFGTLPVYSNQMNMYCANACAGDARLNLDQCKRHCGLAPGWGGASLARNHGPHHMPPPATNVPAPGSGQHPNTSLGDAFVNVDTHRTTGLFLVAIPEAKFGWGPTQAADLTQDSGLWIDNPIFGGGPVATDDRQIKGGSRILIQDNWEIRGGSELTNSHYAGGMVFETISGPLSSICSGNREYWVAGSNSLGEMEHRDLSGNRTIDSEARIYPMAGQVPERLFCAHRHQQPDLYLRVGSSSSFSIFGAMPF